MYLITIFCDFTSFAEIAEMNTRVKICHHKVYTSLKLSRPAKLKLYECMGTAGPRGEGGSIRLEQANIV